MDGVEEIVKRFWTMDSFVGIDLGNLDSASYFHRAYDTVRKYSKDALVILSDRSNNW